MEISLWFLFSALFCFSAASATDSKKNPADQLVSIINTNRTSHKSSSLFDNQGLGCLALEYIKAYEGQCGAVGDMKRPPDSSFTDTFAPNCGVVVTSMTVITGRFLGCQTKYVGPEQAFDILVNDAKSLDVLYSKNHTEVGAAVSGTDGGSPYFWCVLFSNGKTNNSFLLEGGVAKSVRPGCYSGNDADCTGAASSILAGAGLKITIVAFVAAAFGLML